MAGVVTALGTAFREKQMVVGRTLVWRSLVPPAPVRQ